MKQVHDMHKKLNDQGITLIELIIAITLLTVVLFSAYYFLDFSTDSLTETQAQFEAGDDARMAMLDLEEDIRKAKAVKIGVTNHKAVELLFSGMGLNVYTDEDNDGVVQLVQYKLENDQLKRGVAILGDTPTVWSVIADKVKNNMTPAPTPIFSISGKTVRINLLVLDEEEELIDRPVSVEATVTVRSKGAME